MTRPEEGAILAQVGLPLTSADPLTLSIDRFALLAACVNRGSISRLGGEWKRPGVYFLLGAGLQPDRYRVYVGQAASRPLTTRLSEHLRLDAWDWRRVVLVTRATRDGFHPAAVGWLEGRMYDLMQRAIAADVVGTRPPDNPLPEAERVELEHFVAPIAAILRAVGASPDTPEQSPIPTPLRPHRRVSIRDLIDANLLAPGDRLRGQRGTDEVFALVTDGGQLLIGNQPFDTPSGAAAHFLGRQEDGWHFWKVASGTGEQKPLAALRNALQPPTDRATPGQT